MSDISQEVQKQVARIRDMISTTKVLLPDSQCNFVIYEMMIERAEKAIREQDVVTMVKLLPQLKEMD